MPYGYYRFTASLNISQLHFSSNANENCVLNEYKVLGELVGILPLNNLAENGVSSDSIAQFQGESSRHGFYLSSLEQLNDKCLIKAWENLALNASEPNPFYEPGCLIPALTAFDPQGDIAIVQFWQCGELRGLFPLQRSNNYYDRRCPHLAIWVHDNAFCGAPLVEKNWEFSFWNALSRWIGKMSRSAIFLHIAQIDEDGPIYQNLLKINSLRAQKIVLAHREERALLRSDLSPDDYYGQSLNAKRRKEYHRVYRRLSEMGEMRFEKHQDDTAIERWTQEFLELEQSGWKGEAGSALASALDTRQYFEKTMRAMARAGRLERLALRIDDRAIAMLVSFMCAPGCFAFKTCFDEDLKRFSPGVILQRENLKILENEQIDWCDSCASPDHPMINHFWRERRSIVSVNMGLGGGARKLAFRAVNKATQ